MNKRLRVRNLSSKAPNGTMKRIVDDVVQRMIAGETIELDKDVSFYFHPNSLISVFKANDAMRHIISRACTKVADEGMFAGSIGAKTWGVPKTKVQLLKILASKYSQLQGRAKSSSLCVEWATKNNLLPEGMTQKSLKAYVPQELAKVSA